MKPIRLHILVLIAIQLLFLLPILRAPFYQSHDGELHLARFAAYITAIKDGDIPPRWAGNLNHGYGTPILNFFAPLVGYLATALYALGFDLTTAFKAIIGAAFIAAPITFYYWLSQTPLKSFAFIGALLFGLAPYQLLNLYVRGDIGELLGVLFVPWTLAFIERIKKQPTSTNLAPAGVVFAMLVLSHNAISLMFAPIIVLYALFTTNRNVAMKVFASLILGLGISAYFWIPGLLDQKYINSQLFAPMFREHFATLAGLVHKPWGFGTQINEPGGLSPQIGLVLSVLSVGLFLVLKQAAKDRKQILFWIIVFISAIYLSIPASSLFWGKTPLLSKLQFPWRFVSVITFAGAVLATYALKLINRLWFTALVAVLAITTTIPMAKVQKSILVSDASAFSHQGTTALHGEATTVWTAGDPSTTPTEPIQIIEGNGTIESYIRNNSRHSFALRSDQNAKILDNTLYFPGWKAFVDGKEVFIEFQDPSHRGLITFSVPPGNHSIQVVLKETRPRQLANAISLLSLGFAIVLLLSPSVILGLTRNLAFQKTGSRLKGRDDN